MKRVLAMKRTLLLILSIGLCVYAGIGDVEPKPVETKPVIVQNKGAWTIGKTVVAYYCRVKMPDGTVQELSSKTPLDTKGWDSLAARQWEAMKAAEAEPQICPYCGRPMP